MSSQLRLIIFAALGAAAPGLAGCAEEATETKPQPEERVDLEADGWPQPEDCDDLNAGVHPEVPERCDGVDNDCDGVVDEAGGATWYWDGDGDGHGSDDTAQNSCMRPAGAVLLGGDCDDADPSAHPGADELCDGIDQDCDGRIDASLRGHDFDGDGFAGAPSPWSPCEGPPPVVAYTGDCDDDDPLIFPGAGEVCGDGVDSDSDCDGNVSCIAVSVTTETASCDYAWALDDLLANGWSPCESCTFEVSPFTHTLLPASDIVGCDPEYVPWFMFGFRGGDLYLVDSNFERVYLTSTTGGWADGLYGFDHTFVEGSGPETLTQRLFGEFKLDEFDYYPEDDDIGGRPFTVDGAARLAATGDHSGGWSDPAAADTTQPPPQLQRRIADRWAQLGRMEHASVGSFARFSLELLALGAPPALLSEAAAAMADEVRHAQACFGLAETLGGEPVGVGALNVRGCIAHIDQTIDVHAIFASLFTEACVAETVAAAQAERALAAAVEPAVRHVLAEIVVDEARHAAYGWRCAKWMLEAHPELRSVARTLLAQLRPADGPLPPIDVHAEHLAHFGLLDARAQAIAARDAYTKVIQPAAALLLGGGEDCA